MGFDSKVSSLEEREDLDKLSMDELNGILIAYEMITEQEKPSIKEVAFKVSKKTKKNNLKSKSYSSCSEDSYDEEEANFVRKLKRGTSKFKGKLFLKCFKCGRIGHFSSKCLYGKGSHSDEREEEPSKNKKKYQKSQKVNWLKKKTLHSREDNFSFDEDDSDSDSGKVYSWHLKIRLKTMKMTMKKEERWI